MSGVRSIYSVIKAPLTTEKTTVAAAQRKYFFWVDRDANKIEIKKAVEKVYSVKVDKVASMTVKGKLKRIRANQPGKTTSWKKAVVTLAQGHQIKLT
ncbi:MAG: 50S ribosomal protein L23 [Candidatus Omnitrophota bacterium]|nr:MAG: 50S ribosomal protein L23 [Candidatus Omnitrophota bacterium]